MNRKVAAAVGGLAAVAAVAVVALAGVAAGAGPPTAASNLAAAQEDIAARLAAFVPPPGWTPVPGNPAGNGAAPSVPIPPLVDPNLVDATRWFVATGTSAADVLAYEQAHPPAGSQGTGTSGQTGPGGTAALTSVSFSLPAEPGVLSQRQLMVSASDLPSGEVAISLDAQDVWITPRPPWEQIPAGVRSLSIVAKALTGRASTAVIVRSRAKIAALVAAVNALPVEQPGLHSCFADFGPIVTVRLFTARSFRALASLVLGGPCDAASFTFGSTQGPALYGSAALLARINRIGMIPSCRASQLRPVGRLRADAVPGGQATFTLASASPRLCLLSGYPRFTLRDRLGIRLPVAERRARAWQGSEVDMTPGVTATFEASWNPPARNCADPPASATIHLPGRRTGAIEIPVPQHPAQPWPCRGAISVQPFSRFT